MAALSRLDIDDQPFSLYLLVQPNGDSLELRAFDGAESWTGKITGRQMKEMAAKVKYVRIFTYLQARDMFSSPVDLCSSFGGMQLIIMVAQPLYRRTCEFCN